METRPLGEMGQESSVLTFGAIALDALEQEAADEMVEDERTTMRDRGAGRPSPVPWHE